MGALSSIISTPKAKSYQNSADVQAKISSASADSAATDPALAAEEERVAALARASRSNTIGTSQLGVASVPPFNGFSSGYVPGWKSRLGE